MSMMPPTPVWCELRRIYLPGTGVKIALLAAAHFHGFGVARRGPWNTWVNSLERCLAPHAYYDGDEEQLYEPVTGVYRSEHQRHVLVHHSTQQNQEGEN